MGVLTELPSYRICTDKGRFDINPAFDIILEVQRLYKEESLTDYEKIQQALSMLVRNRWNLRLLKPAEQLKLMQDITSRYIEVEKRPQIKKSPVSVLDFERDGDYIYASFMQAYQIDLIDEQGKLPWKKFLYLFNGLPADTKIKQIMRIRQMRLKPYLEQMGQRPFSSSTKTIISRWQRKSSHLSPELLFQGLLKSRRRIRKHW